MKKTITINSIGNITQTSSYRIVKKSNSKKKVKIRNNPKRKGRVYND